jgi:biopolymer transport protein ExbD
MTWKVRHEGSPRAVEGLTLQQVVQGLLEGQWEPTDEVMGPQDEHWTAIENHPQLAEVAADLEPPEPKHYDDETRLDMTALIDVCLVLLVFFILTTTYAALQRLIEMPAMAADKPLGAMVITKEKVDQVMVKVDVRMRRVSGGDKDKEEPVIKVEGETVAPEDLRAVLSRFARDRRKTELLIDYSWNVPHGTIIAIQDAASGAGYNMVHILVPRDELEKAQ